LIGRDIVARVIAALAVWLAVAWSGTAMAQTAPPGALESAVHAQAAPGQAAAFEKALAAHLSWLRAQGDPWRWEVWQVIAGPDLDQYVIRSGGHDWAALDSRAAMAARASAHWAETVGPYVRSAEGTISMSRRDLSRLSPTPGRPTLLSTNRFIIKYDRFSDFAAILPKLAEAMTKSEYVYFTWTQVLSGGRHYTMSMDFPKQGWLDNNPIPTPYWTMVEGAYGAAEAARMRAIWFGAIELHTTGAELYRPDLSSPAEGAAAPAAAGPAPAPPPRRRFRIPGL